MSHRNNNNKKNKKNKKQKQRYVKKQPKGPTKPPRGFDTFEEMDQAAREFVISSGGIVLPRKMMDEMKQRHAGRKKAAAHATVVDGEEKNNSGMKGYISIEKKRPKKPTNKRITKLIGKIKHLYYANLSADIMTAAHIDGMKHPKYPTSILPDLSKMIIIENKNKKDSNPKCSHANQSDDTTNHSTNNDDANDDEEPMVDENYYIVTMETMCFDHNVTSNSSNLNNHVSNNPSAPPLPPTTTMMNIPAPDNNNDTKGSISSSSSSNNRIKTGLKPPIKLDEMKTDTDVSSMPTPSNVKKVRKTAQQELDEYYAERDRKKDQREKYQNMDPDKLKEERKEVMKTFVSKMKSQTKQINEPDAKQQFKSNIAKLSKKFSLDEDKKKRSDSEDSKSMDDSSSTPRSVPPALASASSSEESPIHSIHAPLWVGLDCKKATETVMPGEEIDKYSQFKDIYGKNQRHFQAHIPRTNPMAPAPSSMIPASLRTSQNPSAMKSSSKISALTPAYTPGQNQLPTKVDPPSSAISAVSATAASASAAPALATSVNQAALTAQLINQAVYNMNLSVGINPSTMKSNPAFPSAMTVNPTVMGTNGVPLVMPSTPVKPAISTNKPFCMASFMAQAASSGISPLNSALYAANYTTMANLAHANTVAAAAMAAACLGQSTTNTTAHSTATPMIPTRTVNPTVPMTSLMMDQHQYVNGFDGQRFNPVLAEQRRQRRHWFMDHGSDYWKRGSVVWNPITDEPMDNAPHIKADHSSKNPIPFRKRRFS